MIFAKKKQIDTSNLLKEITSSKKLQRYVMFFIGVFLSAFAFNVFLKPCNLTFGLSGLSIIIEKFFGVDSSLVILLGNVLLLIASLVFLGIDKTKSTVLGSLLYPLLVKLTAFIPELIDFGDTETIVIALCGALISGIGTGLVFKNNFTTGGSDVVKQILSQYGKMPYSKANLYSEGLIMVVGGFFFGWQAFIYSIITLALSGTVSDRVILGISEYKTLEIITTEEEAIKKFIMESLNHGVTEIDAQGGYTHKKKKILLCAIPTREYFVATEAIKKIDPEAFVIIIDTYEIQGHKSN